MYSSVYSVFSGDNKLCAMPLSPAETNQQWERDPQGYIRHRVYRCKVLDITGDKF
jgi:hypothetical protein